MKRYIYSDNKFVYRPEDYSDSERFSEDSETRAWHALHTTDPNVLEVYSYDPRQAVLYQVGANVHTPVDVLMRLASDFSDGNTKAREGVLRNKTTPAEIVRILADDPNVFNRGVAAAHPNMPVDCLIRLADDYYGWVRELVAYNTNTPIDILERLTHDRAARGNALKTLAKLQQLGSGESE